MTSVSLGWLCLGLTYVVPVCPCDLTGAALLALWLPAWATAGSHDCFTIFLDLSSFGTGFSPQVSWYWAWTFVLLSLPFESCFPSGFGSSLHFLPRCALWGDHFVILPSSEFYSGCSLWEPLQRSGVSSHAGVSRPLYWITYVGPRTFLVLWYPVAWYLSWPVTFTWVLSMFRPLGCFSSPLPYGNFSGLLLLLAS